MDCKLAQSVRVCRSLPGFPLPFKLSGWPVPHPSRHLVHPTRAGIADASPKNAASRGCSGSRRLRAARELRKRLRHRHLSHAVGPAARRMVPRARIRPCSCGGRLGLPLRPSACARRGRGIAQARTPPPRWRASGGDRGCIRKVAPLSGSLSRGGQARLPAACSPRYACPRPPAGGGPVPPGQPDTHPVWPSIHGRNECGRAADDHAEPAFVLRAGNPATARALQLHSQGA